MFASLLCMKAREVYHVDLHSDLCQMTYGKGMVYISNYLISFMIFITMILFLILFSDIALTLFATKGNDEDLTWVQYILSTK